MQGSGVNGVALLADNPFELQHFMLQRLTHRAGVPLANFHIGTVSQPGLLEELQRKQVKVIVPLGERALGQVLNESDIVRWRGRVAEHPHIPGMWVVPVFQPSKLLPRHSDEEEEGALRHPPRFHGIWMRDIHHAIQIARAGFQRLPVTYLVDPGAARFAEFADEYFTTQVLHPENTWLSWDVETPWKQKTDNEDELDEKENVLDGVILRISFCFRSGYAISVPWDATYLPTIIRLLKSRGIMVVWNGTTFDVPVVTTAGYDVLGTIWEGMDAYHLFQSDLPKGLEWVSSEASDLLPWKHLAQAQPGWYSCTDADSALRNMLFCKEQLTKTGQWGLFLNHVVRLMPILKAAGRRGNCVDLAKRDEVRSTMIAMRDELVSEIQRHVPRELMPRTLYKCQPDEVIGDYPKLFTSAGISNVGGWDITYESSDEKVCSACGQFASNKSEHFKGSEGPPNPKTGKPTRLKNPCKETGADISSKKAFAPRFHRLEPFNANSSQQLMAYMRYFGHPIGRDKRDSSKETADAGHLKSLVKKAGAKFPIYALALQLHKVSKTIGTYTPEPDENGKIHTEFVNSVSTWRLGSRKVKFGTQIQNWGKRDENKYAKEARRQIIASPDCKLVQIDSSAVEAVMQGHYMNDPEYMRTASKSIHAWLACKALHLEFTPANVELVKEKHESLYLRMKVVNYLTNFSGGARLMADTFPEQFPTVAVAQAAQDDLYRLLPTLKTYHHSERWEAHTKTYLTSPWGYRHWFYDVFKPGKDNVIRLGKDGKRCVAFRPQNSNAGFQKDNLLMIAASRIDWPPITELDYLEEHWEGILEDIQRGITWAQFMGTNVSVHDSACLDVPDALVENCSRALLAIFTRPIPQMNGLRIGAEVEAGDNWGGYDEVTNPGGMKRIAKVVVDDYTFEHTAAGLDRAA